MSAGRFWEEEIVVSFRQVNAGAHSRNAPPQSEHRWSATTRGGKWHQCKRLIAVLVLHMMVRQTSWWVIGCGRIRLQDVPNL